VALAAGLILPSCSASGAVSTIAPLNLHSASQDAPRNAARGFIYVANASGNTVSVFSLQNQSVRTISDSIEVPLGVAVDSKNKLYVANGGANNVTVYQNGGEKLIRSITERRTHPLDVRVDSEGTVFARMKRDVIAYPSSGKKSYKLAGGPIAMDHNDNLYIGRGTGINVYAPGAKKATRKISSNITDVYAMGFDAQNNLYVGDWNVVDSGPCFSRVEEFAAGTSTLLNTITNGICGPLAFASDSAGNLYVANDEGNEGTGNSVTVYASGSFTLLRTLTTGVSEPTDLAMDSADTLYVASPPINSVAVYASGASSPSVVLKKGLNEPIHLVVSP
jgi:DNA-binding beta-propeller fold protein YncE